MLILFSQLCMRTEHLGPSHRQVRHQFAVGKGSRSLGGLQVFPPSERFLAEQIDEGKSAAKCGRRNPLRSYMHH